MRPPVRETQGDRMGGNQTVAGLPSTTTGDVWIPPSVAAPTLAERRPACRVSGPNADLVVRSRTDASGELLEQPDGGGRDALLLGPRGEVVVEPRDVHAHGVRVRQKRRAGRLDLVAIALAGVPGDLM